MNQEQQRIWDYLRQNAIGFSNKKTSDEITTACSLPYGRTNEPVRELIRDMILNQRCCIGSDNDGFWIIQNQQELDDVIGSLETRAAKIRDRATALKQNFTIKP